MTNPIALFCTVKPWYDGPLAGDIQNALLVPMLLLVDMSYKSCFFTFMIYHDKNIIQEIVSFWDVYVDSAHN